MADAFSVSPLEVCLKIFAFLSPQDRLNVATASPTFSQIYFGQKKLNLRKAYSTNEILFQKIIFGFHPELLSSVNLNHCHWLQGRVITKTLVYLVNLQELFLLDIKLGFVDINEMLSKLQQVTSLSVSITEKSSSFLMEDDCQSYQLMERKLLSHFPLLQHTRQAWARLKRVALHLFNFNYPYLVAALSWCEDCTDLSIILEHCWSGTTANSFVEYCQVIMDSLEGRLLWMKKISKFVYAASLRGFVEFSVYKTLSILICVPGSKMERFWVTGIKLSENLKGLQELPSTMKSFVKMDFMFPYNFVNAKNIEYLSGMFQLESPLLELGNIKLFHGSFKHKEVFSCFCESHPKLETLALCKTGGVESFDLRLLEKLCNLKTLFLSPSLINESDQIFSLLEYCSNLEEFHLNTFLPDRSDVGCRVLLNFRKINRINHKLRRITIGGLTQIRDDQFLQNILAHCKGLQSVEIIEGNNVILGSLHRDLPQLSFLTDLRIREIQLIGDDLVLLFQSVCCCVNLEKLALTSFRKFQPVPDYFAMFPGQLEILVSLLKKLVALHIIVYVLSPQSCLESSLVLEQISQSRPLWHLISNRSASGNDGTIPLIYYNSLVVSKDYDWILPETFLIS